MASTVSISVSPLEFSVTFETFENCHLISCVELVLLEQIKRMKMLSKIILGNESNNSRNKIV